MPKLDRITVNPKVFQGQPCVRNLRIPVSLIVKFVSVGKTADEIIADYPELEKEASKPMAAVQKYRRALRIRQSLLPQPRCPGL